MRFILGLTIGFALGWTAVILLSPIIGKADPKDPLGATAK